MFSMTYACCVMLLLSLQHAWSKTWHALCTATDFAHMLAGVPSAPEVYPR